VHNLCHKCAALSAALLGKAAQSQANTVLLSHRGLQANFAGLQED